jgi:acetyltransferase-like isoleucine patch superfamily enzyme
MFRLFRLWPKVAYRLRGIILRRLVIWGGGACGEGLRVEKGLRLRQGFHRGLKLGSNIYLGRNITIDCLENAILSIGDNTTFTESIFISCCERVTIGADTLIGEYCSIRDANHDFSDVNRPISSQPMLSKRIVIGPDVWVGRGCAILAGVQIGAGAVIAANSVVTRDIPEKVIALGAPAKPVRSRNSN